MNTSENTIILFENFSYMKKQDVYKDSIHQNFMIFSTWVLEKEHLNNLIIKWYENKEYYHIYDFYLDSHNWFEGTEALLSNVMFNNRFLNLIQALEDYHRKLNDFSIPEKMEFENNKKDVLNLLNKDSNLKKWANDHLKFNKYPDLKGRLSYLVNYLMEILTGLFKDNNYFKNFPDQAKNYRDMLSHGKMKGTYQGKELNQLFLMAQILLTICILKSLEIDNQTIIKIIIHNTDFRRIIYELNLKGQIIKVPISSIK